MFGYLNTCKGSSQPLSLIHILMDAFEEPVERIMEAIHSVLERTPPELVADVSTNGIIMTGGGSLVYGCLLYTSRCV